MDNLPPELLLLIVSYLPIQSINALQALSRSYLAIIKANENMVYYHAAVVHRFVESITEEGSSDPDMVLQRCKAKYMGSLMDNVTDWKKYCHKCFQLEGRWMGEREPLHSHPRPNRLTAPGRQVHRFKIDEVEKTILSTSRRGGLIVSSVDTQEVLWFLPFSYVREYSHLEYGNGFAIFDREGQFLEVWRRSIDTMNPSTYLPCRPVESQIEASPDHLPDCIIRGTPPESDAAPAADVLSSSYKSTSSINPEQSFPRRGAYAPFALLENPAPSRAYRFVYPHLLVASTLGRKAFVWHIPTATLIQTVDIPPPDHGPHPDDEPYLSYVEISNEHIFVCWSNGLRLYRWKCVVPGQRIGQVDFSIPPTGPTTFIGRPLLIQRYGSDLAREQLIVPEGLMADLRNYDSFTGVHVSPDGLDIVALCESHQVLFIRNFPAVWAKITTQPPTEDYGNGEIPISGVFAVEMDGDCQYLAFDGNRATVVVAGDGTRVLNIHDRRRVPSYLYPQGDGSPTKLRIARLPSDEPTPNIVGLTSCLQVTETAVWATHSHIAGFHVQSMISCIDLGDMEPIGLLPPTSSKWGRRTDGPALHMDGNAWF